MEIKIIGAGDVGFQLAKRLSYEKHNITLLDQDSEKVARAKDQLDAIVVKGSATSLKSLDEAGFAECDVYAALTNNDEANILSCALAKNAGARTTIARIRNPEFLTPNEYFKPENFGVDFLIQPERETADVIVGLIRQASATDVVNFDDERVQLTGIRLEKNSPAIHSPLKELWKDYGNPPINIVAIKRRQRTIVPRGDDLLMGGDQIFIISDPTFLDEALRFFGKKDVKVENIMILGGGLIGRFVAQSLEDEIGIKIIEIDEEKAGALANNLRRSLVICGDGSDLDLIAFEGLSDMDEFVAVTGNDENNIIVSMVARHLDVPRTITLVRKLDYLQLAPAIGMDSVVSKQLITVNAIQKFIRRQTVAYFAELPGVDAEIVEFIAGKKSKIVGKPLSKISFPENAIVGAILKDPAKLEIPKGHSQIEPGDRVIVFSLPDAIKSVEKLFE